MTCISRLPVNGTRNQNSPLIRHVYVFDLYLDLPVIYYIYTETDIAPALDTQMVRFQSIVLYLDVPVIQYTKTETDIAPALDTQIVRYQSFVLYSDLPVIQYTITEA